MFSLHGHHYSTRYQIPLDVVMSMLSGFGSTFRLQNHSVILLEFTKISRLYMLYCVRISKGIYAVTKNWDTACKIVFVTRLPCTFSGTEERPLTLHRHLSIGEFELLHRSTSFFRRNRRCCPRLALSADKVGLRGALTSAQTRVNDVESEGVGVRRKNEYGERKILTVER